MLKWAQLEVTLTPPRQATLIGTECARMDFEHGLFYRNAPLKGGATQTGRDTDPGWIVRLIPFRVRGKKRSDRRNCSLSCFSCILVTGAQEIAVDGT